jgi:hypothetical protein
MSQPAACAHPEAARVILGRITHPSADAPPYSRFVFRIQPARREVIYGGTLLNRNPALVDKIKDTVYRGEVYQGREIGTATIFLGDVRIATTVRTRDGQWANR